MWWKVCAIGRAVRLRRSGAPQLVAERELARRDGSRKNGSRCGATSFLASVAIVVLAVGLAGCGDGGETEEVPEGDRLEDLLGIGNASGAQELLRRRQLQLEEAIRECMVAEGFDYIPYVQPALDLGPTAGTEVSEEEYARVYGYGVATVIDEVLDSDILEPEANPNFDIREALSDAEREAYDFALLGEAGVEVGEDGTAGGVDGCTGEAFTSVFGGGGPFELLNELGRQLEDLQARIDADPRAIDANLEWSACMAERGFDYSSPSAARSSIEQRAQSLVLRAFMAAGSQDLPEDAPPDLSAALGNALSEFDEDALASLADEEIAVATADVACQAGLREAYDDIAAEYEAAFIDENRELIDSLRGE